MKKKIYSVLVLTMLVLSVFLFAACSADDRNVSRAFIKPGTVQLQVMINDTLETDNIVLVIEYKNGTSKEIKADKLEIADFDTTTLGFKTLTVTYKSLMAEIDIEVVNESVKYVKTSFAIESKLLAEYNSRRLEQPVGSRTEFYDKTQPIYVGTDNAFNFRIEATGLDQFGNLAQKLQKVDAIITVEEKISENNYTLLEGETLDSLVEIDELTVTFQFKKAAEGKTLKITVKAVEIEDGYDEDASRFSAEVTIIEGYNVYTTKEFSIYNNYEDSAYNWESFKEQYGLKGITTKAIILQTDLKLTKTDVPAEYFWKQNEITQLGATLSNTDQEVVGSLKDFDDRGLYNRIINKNETFNFIGNYFKIDVSEMPKVIVERDNTTII
ncbi:MAG: bacterial Ig-like domain-containing protein, partial [Christensenellales bacterium]